MTIDYPNISIILNKYLFGEICLTVETSATVPESVEDLASTGFSREGDPNDHELFEKYYSIVNRNQGINFKIYTLKGKIWGSGLDFHGFRLSTILKMINKPANMRLFLDSKNSDGALIINDLCVCRFSYHKENPLALTFETNAAMIDDMKNRKISTKTVENDFTEIYEVLARRNNRKLRKIKQILVATGHILK